MCALVTMGWVALSNAAHDDELKAAALMLLGPAIAFFIAGRLNQLRDYDISALFAIWLAPLLARSLAKAFAMPIGFIAMPALYILIMRHLLHARTCARVSSLEVAQA